VQHSEVPIVNLESSLSHPCQAMADAMTLRQRLAKPRESRILLTWAYHPKALPMAVPNSFLLSSTRLGAEVVFARPEGYDLDPETPRKREEKPRQAGGDPEDQGRPEGRLRRTPRGVGEVGGTPRG